MYAHLYKVYLKFERKSLIFGLFLDVITTAVVKVLNTTTYTL